MSESCSSFSQECFCGRIYTSQKDMEEHRIAQGHFASHRCGKYCKHSNVAPRKFEIYKCGSCSKICANMDILHDHHIATGHCFCSDCDIHFESERAFKTHRETEIHASEFKCCNCNIFFGDIHALVAHMESRAHRKPLIPHPSKTAKISGTTKDHIPGPPVSHKCKKCPRTFKTVQSLEQHLQSVKHKPLSDLSCPMGKCSRKNFASPSALLHHLESGACKSRMNRDEICKIVRLYDEDEIIHSQPALTPSVSLEGPLGSSSPSSRTWMIPTDTQSEWSLPTPSPSEGSIIHGPDEWSLLDSGHVSSEPSLSTEAAAVMTLQCPLCPKKHNKFANLLALHQHINSPVHSPKMYHCPSNLITVLPNTKKGRKKQEKYFTTLSGLSQHLESGACGGGKQTFLNCIDLVQGLLKQLGFGGMRVLLPDTQA